MLTTTLFLFAVILIPILLVVWVGVAYSNKRWYGNNSPLKVARTFQISARQYFTRPDFICFVLSFALFYTMLFFLFKTLPMDPDLVWGYFVLFIAVGGFFAYVGVQWASSEIHFWKHTKNMKIETFPLEKVVLVSDGERELRLKKGDIKELFAVGKINPKGRSFLYYVYYLQNGSSFVLTYAMPGRWILEDYLGYIEPQVIEDPMPRIAHLPLISIVNN
jgi:hypothetical protein